MNLYDKLISLTELPEAFREWKPYREMLTEYICENVKSGSSLAIYGAGRCNDIDIGVLAEKGIKITLVDQDYSAMKTACEFYNVNLEIKVSNFVGIENDTYREFATLMESVIKLRGINNCSGELEEMAYDFIEESYRECLNKKISFGKDVYDYAVVAGVHSQLNNMFSWIWQVYMQELHKDGLKVFECIADKTTEIIQRFNCAVSDSVCQNMIIVNEKERVGVGGYVEGAYQAMKDISDNYKVVDRELMEWTFSVKQNQYYKMLLQNVQIKQ